MAAADAVADDLQDQREAAAAQQDADPVTRSIAIKGHMIAVATGRHWRVIDFRNQQQLHSSKLHEGAVRGVSLSQDGQHLLTCADDKTARIWKTQDWSCLRILKACKKASACTFSEDGRHVFFADRFGDVLVAAVPPAAPDAVDAAEADACCSSASAASPVAEPAEVLLGHLQAIITSLTVTGTSTGQPVLVSTDRDGKVRCSVLPKDPTKGSYVIQSYGLGHTAFVACSAAVPAGQQQQQQQHLVLSGSGDGTIRLWDVNSGKQSACFVASEPPKQPAGAKTEEQSRQQPQQEQLRGRQQQLGQSQEVDHGDVGDTSAAAAAAKDKSNGENNDCSSSDDEVMEGRKKQPQQQQGSKVRYTKGERVKCSAVLSLAVSPDGSTIAAAVEGEQEVLVLRLDASAGTMTLQQKLAFGDVSNPAAVAFDDEGRLWVVGGVLLLLTESAHVGVAVQQGESWVAATSDVLPPALRSYLECRVQSEEESAAQQQGSYYHEGFKRKVYSQEEIQYREERKRQRRDERETQRLAALRTAEESQQQGPC